MRRSLLVLAIVAAVAAAGIAAALTTGGSGAARQPVGIHKIKHVIVIMQENRSFDQYFGTYPGADGLPRNAAGEFTSCAPDPATGKCEKPFHDMRDLNGGGPHGAANAKADIDDGKMDGFVRSAE